jgi:hypothetical protein
MIWSMSASEVFVAPASKEGEADCACYYKLPTLQALLSMTTPVVFVGVFVLKIFAYIRSVSYGDYLYFKQYDVPWYLAKQSPSHVEGTLVAPLVVGTDASDVTRPPLIANTSLRISQIQRCLLWLAFVTLGLPAAFTIPVLVPSLLLLLAEVLPFPWRLCLVAPPVLVAMLTAFVVRKILGRTYPEKEYETLFQRMPFLSVVRPLSRTGMLLLSVYLGLSLPFVAAWSAAAWVKPTTAWQTIWGGVSGFPASQPPYFSVIIVSLWIGLDQKLEGERSALAEQERSILNERPTSVEMTEPNLQLLLA